jgi:SAM-dependent methyltransferase
VDPADYDRWYQTPRGRWIGERETELVRGGLAPRPGESLLDVGCGTGYFTRALAERVDGPVSGVDVDPDRVAYARAREEETGRITYAVADALALPYATASFDMVMSVAALCFVDDEAAAVREIVRVARRRFAIGLLNRHSLLWLWEGRDGGRGGYRGARWHTVSEARSLLHGLSVRDIRVRTAVHLPGGGQAARLVERVWPSRLPTGAFILVTGTIKHDVPFIDRESSDGPTRESS